MTLYCVDACREDGHREPVVIAEIIGVATHHSACTWDKSVWVGNDVLHRRPSANNGLDMWNFVIVLKVLRINLSPSEPRLA
jgi:hypothetical protein